MWTKLELDPAIQRTQYGEAGKILQEQTTSAGTSKPAVDVVADFLRKVKEHLIQTLDTQFGPKLWRTLPITLVVTVPAVWSDAAKDRTMRAVDKGGFNTSELPQLKRVVTITEPEAAAIHTIKSFSGSVQDEQFAVGDGLIVCDMGGGTVDLISYRVADLDPTTLEEATIGNGDQCGGSFVDRAFIRFLESRLGHEDFVKIAGTRSEDIKRTSMPLKLGTLVQNFVAGQKTVFSGKEAYVIALPHPLSRCEDDEARGIFEGEITITK
jgi:molecular chaperone DnaK (HSP70)